MMNMLSVFWVFLAYLRTSSSFILQMEEQGAMSEGSRAASALLEFTLEPNCATVLLSCGNGKVIQELNNFLLGNFPWSKGSFTIVEKKNQISNDTVEEFSNFIQGVRQFRWFYGCVSVVIFCENSYFLETLAEISLEDRMAVWSTKLVIVTSVSFSSLTHLMTKHWTYSRMNTMFLNSENRDGSRRWTAYTMLPYTQEDKDVLVPVAYWTPNWEIKYLNVSGNVNFFPEKYNNLFGHQVYITALPWEPYWFEKVVGKNEDGTSIYSYAGSDANLVKSVAQALNFTFTSMPVDNWLEVTERVAERQSFIVGVGHWVMTERLKRYDYSYTYKTIFFGFCMAKPEIKPQWQGLYYPLGNLVWLSILMSVIVMPLLMYLLMNARITKPTRNEMRISVIAEEVLATLFAQSLSGRLPKESSSLLILGIWLVFAFIVGTAYRGNLTASLTLPRPSTRPETLGELVESVDKINMPPYGEDHRKFFQASDTEVYQKYASLINLGHSLVEGLQRATEYREAQAEDKIVVQYLIAKLFRNEDGSTPLYVGKEGIMFAPEGLPIPHDAPYKPQVDKAMMKVVEGGLYDKWVEDTLRETQGFGIKEDKLEQQPLTIVHLQGIFMLQTLGYVLGLFVLIAELILWKKMKC